jgi:hypothetical protein
LARVRRRSLEGNSMQNTNIFPIRHASAHPRLAFE